MHPLVGYILWIKIKKLQRILQFVNYMIVSNGIDTVI